MPVLIALVLLLSSVTTSWCAADCAAKALSPTSCHHEQTATTVCDDPTTIVPEASLPTPVFGFEPSTLSVVSLTPLAVARPHGLQAPSPPLRL